MKVRGRKTAVIVVGAALLLVGAAVAALSALPGYFEHRFRDAVARATSGPEWSEKATAQFRIRYAGHDPGVTEVEAALPAAYDTVTTLFGRLSDQIPLFIFPDVATLDFQSG